MLKAKIKNKSARVGIIGLGYVGLPLAAIFSKAGYRVLGIDLNKERVRMVNMGKSYIADVSDDMLKGVRATTAIRRIKELDTVCICVPTPLTKTKDPDLSYVIKTAESVASLQNNKMLVVLESTTYPGTTRHELLPIFERYGHRLDDDVFLAFSPEMVDPGNQTYNIENMPKIVGGMSKKSTDLACSLYSQITPSVIPVSSSEVAEMVKVFSNVFRNVNIALVNELALLCHRMGISVWEVIDTTAKKPLGYMPFYPGLVGGHCIGTDPYYLSQKSRELDFHTRFIELSADVNEQMPYYVLGEIMRELDVRGKTLKGARVLVLGVAFKRDVADIRDSGSVKLIELLQRNWADVRYHDPYVPSIILDGGQMESVDLFNELLIEFLIADCVVIATDHSCFDAEQIVARSQFVYDIRGMTRHVKFRYNNVVRMGE